MATPINDLVKFEPQIAGHDRLLQFSTNDLIVIKPCTEREHRFYEDAQKYPDFSNWIPECYGTLRAPTENELKVLKQEGQVEPVTNLATSLQRDHRAFDSDQRPLNEHLCIENILYGFKRPCIMDVKIGYQLYEDDAHEAKMEKMIKNAKGTTTETMGVRISGMKTYDPIHCTWNVYNKAYGRSRSKDDLADAFLAYFFPTSKYSGAEESQCSIVRDKQDNEDDGTAIRKPIAPKKMRWILECLIDDVQAIRDFVAEHPTLQLIGSSLLFVYEGDRKASDDTWNKMLEEDRRVKDDDNKGKKKQNAAGEAEEQEQDEDEDENMQKLYDVRAIDFSHSRWDVKRTQQDPKLVEALDNLLQLLEICLERQKQEKLNTISNNS